MTDNDIYVKEILAMNETELLDEVISSPEYLADSYYRIFGNAARKRHAQLVEENKS